MVIHFGEAQILKRKVLHAPDRGIHVGRPAPHVFEKSPQLIFSHPIKWYFSL